VRLEGAFVHEDGTTPIDPDVVGVKYRPPGAPEVTKIYGTDVEVVKDSAGHYHIDVDTSPVVDVTTGHGVWRYRWYSTGNGQAAGELQFTCIASALD
jgi:hypothetical protein